MVACVDGWGMWSSGGACGPVVVFMAHGQSSWWSLQHSMILIPLMSSNNVICCFSSLFHPPFSPTSCSSWFNTGDGGEREMSDFGSVLHIWGSQELTYMLLLSPTIEIICWESLSWLNCATLREEWWRWSQTVPLKLSNVSKNIFFCSISMVKRLL